MPLLKNILHKARPIELHDRFDSYSFPSGHATLSMVLFGLLAVLLARKSPPRLGLIIYVLAGLWIAAVGFSRIYLSAHWPSDVLGGMLFGAVLIGFFALLVEHIDPKSYNPALLAMGTLSVFLLFGLVHAWREYDKNIARYAPHPPLRPMLLADWQKWGWKTLPLSRIDLGGRQKEKFVVQWAGDERELTKILAQIDFKKAPAFTWFHALELLLPTTGLDDLAPLPVLHNGRFPVASYTIKDQGKPRRLVLRFWRSNVIIARQGQKHPLWLGTLRREILTHPFNLATALRQRPPKQDTLQKFGKMLRTLQHIKWLSLQIPDRQEAPLLIRPLDKP